MNPEILPFLGLPFAFIAGVWVMLQYPKAKVVVADILKFVGFLGKWPRRTSLKAEFEGSVNAFSRLFNSEFDAPLLPECKVEWVTDQNYKHLLQPGKAIVRLNFPKGEHDVSFYNAAQAYVQTAFLSQTKLFLRKATSKAIDLLMIKILLRNARRTSITIFNERFSEQEPPVKETFAKLEETDERGLFRQLFVQELHFFGENLGIKSPLTKYEQETETFLQWFYDLATRVEKEQSSLSFFSENFRIGVILVADSETYAKHGARPYVKRANQYSASKCHTIYVLSRGHRRADISEEIVNKLLLTGCFRKLAKRTRMLKFDIRDPIIVTCYSLKPDLAQIETAAWTSLQADFEQNQAVTGTVELVSSKSVRADVYGLKVDIPLEQLSGLPLNDARSLFKEDQTLRLKILRLDRTQGLIELSNVGTETDPQKLCEELGQLGTQIREGTVSRILRDKENQFEFALIVHFAHRDQQLSCFIPRQAATFAKYIPLSVRYEVRGGPHCLDHQTQKLS